MNNITIKFSGNQPSKIVQWEPKKQVPRFQQRSQYIDIIIVSETWLGEAESAYLKGFHVVRKERNEMAGGGVAIFINNKLKYSRKNISGVIY
jgi:hypothetical protein